MARRAGGEDAALSQTSENGLYGTHNLKVIDSNPIPATNASLDFARGSAALSETLSGAASWPKNLDLNRLVSPSRRPHDFRDNFADGLVSPPSNCARRCLAGGRLCESGDVLDGRGRSAWKFTATSSPTTTKAAKVRFEGEVPKDRCWHLRNLTTKPLLRREIAHKRRLLARN